VDTFPPHPTLTAQPSILCYLTIMNILKTLTLSAVIITSITTHAFANEGYPVGNDIERLKAIQISTPNDLQLDCNELSSEAYKMKKIIQTTQNIKDTSDLKSNGVTAAGALGSLIIGTATGGIGLAIGGYLMHQNIEERGDKADDIQYIAAQRRTLMLGIHNAKGCFGPTEDAMLPPTEFDPIAQIALSALNEERPNHHSGYND